MTYVDPHLAAKISAYADTAPTQVAADLRAILDGTYDPGRHHPDLSRCDPAAGTHTDPHRGCFLRGRQ